MVWEVKKLGELCKTGAGGTPLKSNKLFYEKADVPWLLSGEVGYREILHSKNFISRLGLEKSSAKLFPINSVLIAMYGATAGEVGILRFEAATNQAVCAIQPSKHFLPEFLYYFFLAYKAALVAQAVGNAQPNISQQKIRNTDIPVPSIKEQKRIVAILDEAFEQIDQAKANAEQNLKNALEIFDSTLIKNFQIPDNETNKKILNEVAIDFGRGKSKHRPRNDPKLYGGKYPFIQTGDVRNSNRLITKYSKTYNDSGLAQSKLWPKGTLCITIAANIAETGILDFDACFPDSVIGVIADTKQTSNKYLEYLISSVKTRLQKSAAENSAAQSNINLATFENERFYFPNLDVQQTICKNLDRLLMQIETLEQVYQQKIKALDELKQSLLQKAFSGELTKPADGDAA